MENIKNITRGLIISAIKKDLSYLEYLCSHDCDTMFMEEHLLCLYTYLVLPTMKANGLIDKLN